MSVSRVDPFCARPSLLMIKGTQIGRLSSSVFSSSKVPGNQEASNFLTSSFQNTFESFASANFSLNGILLGYEDRQESGLAQVGESFEIS